MTSDYLHQMLGNRSAENETKSNYPVLGEGTSNEDYNDAIWVLDRATGINPKTTTWVDLQLKHAGVKPDSIGLDNVSYDDIPLSQLSHGMQEVIKESKTAAKIKKAIDDVSKKRKTTYSASSHRTDDTLDTERKHFADMWKDFGDDPRVTDRDIMELSERLKKGFEEQMKVINKRCGKAGGGRGRMEMYGHQGGEGKSPVKRTKYGVLGKKGN